jgi:hypothetical protein
MAVTEFSYLGTYLNEKDLRRLNKKYKLRRMLMPEII